MSVSLRSVLDLEKNLNTGTWSARIAKRSRGLKASKSQKNLLEMELQLRIQQPNQEARSDLKLKFSFEGQYLINVHKVH